MAIDTSAGPYWGNRTAGLCPHGTPLDARCFQCRMPSIYAASSPLYHYQFGGWTCAGCGRGYNPQVIQCSFCGPQPKPADFSDEPVSDLCQPDVTHVPCAQRPSSLVLTAPCPPAADGGLCGCDEPEDDEGPCRSVNCSC